MCRWMLASTFLLLLGPFTRSALAQESDTATSERDGRPAQERPAPNYRHPLGLALRHPKGWRVEETVLGLSLLPPDPAPGVEPRELYLLNATGIPREVTTLDDPRVFQQLTALLTATVPFLKPEGKPTPVPKVPAARTYRWRGVNPATGQTVVALVHGKAEQSYFLSLGAIGEEALVERREAVLVELFATLVWGEPALERELVGTWNSDSYTSVGNVPSDRLNLSHRLTVVLLPDGRVRSSSQMGVSGRTGGRDRPGADVAGVVHGDPELGRWAAKDRHLYVLWHEGGAAKYGYYVQGTPGRREMLLTPVAGGAKVLWTEY